jgi:hypothetical protein
VLIYNFIQQSKLFSLLLYKSKNISYFRSHISGENTLERDGSYMNKLINFFLIISIFISFSFHNKTDLKQLISNRFDNECLVHYLANDIENSSLSDLPKDSVFTVRISKNAKIDKIVFNIFKTTLESEYLYAGLFKEDKNKSHT